MKTTGIINFVRHKYVRYGFVLAAGIFLGWLLFGGSANQNESTGHAHEETVQVWTCSMHPQIRQDKPGKCPLCAMDLTPVKTASTSSGALDPDAILLSEEAMALANIQTTKISRSSPVKELTLYGTVQADERLTRSLTSHVNGRIEKLFVNFTGESVRQGQTIATVYSPELLNAQQELLEAMKMQPAQPALVEAAREKLRYWKLTDGQIAAVEKAGTANPVVEIKASAGGIVISRNVSQGDYAGQGSVLFEIADLSRLWVMFEVYEADLPFLKTGDSVEFGLQALPGKTFSGSISFIDPVIDNTTRTAKVRIETANAGMLLKPGMYASATVKSALKRYKNEIVVPKTAVLWTGKRSIVYIKRQESGTPAFTLREVELGTSLGNAYVIESGLNEGDEVVVSGAFCIDASAQLEGKRSMMNDE
jgi:Cu(I)/Ag(I) efflux system membrane fusion protein